MLKKTQEIVQIARKNKEFWQIPKNSNNMATYGINKKMKGVQSERKRGPLILVQDPHLPSNYLLLLLRNKKLTKFKLYHYSYDFYNFWKKAPNAKSIALLSLDDSN